MGIIKAFSGALNGAFADQWKDIITAGGFDEHTAVAPGILKRSSNGRGSNLYGQNGVLTNGSRILVPENTAAFIFSQSGIENILTDAGGYVYENGEDSVLDGGTLSGFLDQVADRFGYGGISAEQKKIAFVNMREIRGLKFGTMGPQIYNDLYYGVDLEIRAFGSFSIIVTDPEKFIRNFVPPEVTRYSFDDASAKAQISGEFIQSFIVALNTLSSTYRISQLPSQSAAIARHIAEEPDNAGSWPDRFGIRLVKVAVENIEFTEDSKALVMQYSSRKMNMRAYDDVSQRTSEISARQAIAEGIKTHGVGDGGGMILGMNMAQNISQGMGINGNMGQSQPKAMTIDEQIAAVSKLKELLDANILTQEEFDAKKKEIMGL